MNITHALNAYTPQPLRDAFGKAYHSGSEAVLRHQMSRHIARYDDFAAYKDAHRRNNDPQVLAQIERNKTSVSKSLKIVREAHRLITVTPDANNTALLEQLVRDEKVHPILGKNEDVNEDHIKAQEL